MPYTIGTYALGTNAQGLVNTFARKVKMTASQIVGKFGLDNCPQSVRDVYRSNNGYSTYFTVCWLVEENDKDNPDELGNKKMPFRSVYWVEGSNDQEVLAATGFEEWAIPVARYDVKGLEEYGVGPAWYALQDSRMLQKMEYDSAMATELGIKPPMQGPTDLAHRINLFPGGYTPNLDPNNAIRPLFQGQLDIGTLDQKIVRVEDRIKRAYSTDLFMMLDQLDRGQMTAQEVMARNQENCSSSARLSNACSPNSLTLSWTGSITSSTATMYFRLFRKKYRTSWTARKSRSSISRRWHRHRKCPA